MSEDVPRLQRRIGGYKGKITSLNHEIERLGRRLASSGLSPKQRETAQRKLTKCKDDIASLETSISEARNQLKKLKPDA